MPSHDHVPSAHHSTPFRRRPEKLSATIARDIVADIRRQEPMTMLPPEAAMVERYQVGRSSLREALRVLETLGIITLRPGPGGGPMVAPLDPVQFARMSTLYFHLLDATYHEVLESRLIIEPVMARLAAEREDREALAVLADYVSLPEPTDEAEYMAQTGGFHGLLCSLSGNRVMDLQAGSLRAIYADRIEGMIFPPDTRNDILEDHRRIAKVVIAGDAIRAERLMRAHMEDFLQQSVKKNSGIIDEVIQWR